MHRVAITFSMIAAVAITTPARAALSLPQNFVDAATPRPNTIAFTTSGNLSYGLGPMGNDSLGGGIVSLEVPVPPSFQSAHNDLPFGGNGFPIFNVRHDPGHDFYTSLTAQVSLPETSTWIMLLLGFAAVGFMMRRTPEYFAAFREPNLA